MDGVSSERMRVYETERWTGPSSHQVNQLKNEKKKGIRQTFSFFFFLNCI
jgi:hypothetical protein